MTTALIEGFRLSSQQERLWCLELECGTCRAQCRVDLEGQLSAEAVRRALHRAVARHEVLRTTYRGIPGVDLPVQVIEEDLLPAWREVDLSGVAPEARENLLADLLREDTEAPFDPAAGPVVRATLAVFAADLGALLLTLPPLAIDGCGLENLVAEIVHLYTSPDGEDELDAAVQYVDYTEWQRELLEDAEGSEGRAYWERQRLLEVPAVELPFGGSPSAPVPFRRASVPVFLDVATRTGIASAAYRCDTSVPIFLLGAWQALLWRLTRQPVLEIGVLVDGRRIEHLRDAVGLFAGHLPVRSRLEGTVPFLDTLETLGQALEEAASQQLFFSWKSLPAAVGGRPYLPLAFEATVWPEKQEAGGVTFTLGHRAVTLDRFALRLAAALRSGGLSLEVQFDSALFEPADISRVAGQYARILAEVVSDPGLRLCEVEVLGEAESRELLVERNATALEVEALLVPERIASWSAEHPEDLAVELGEEGMSFGELEARSNRLGRHLRSLAVGPEVMVGLFLERSVETLVALVGIWKAGGAYVPLDPDDPVERLGFVLEQTGARVVVTVSSLGGRLAGLDVSRVLLDAEAEAIERRSSAALSSGLCGASLAYVLYTSGSTGRPKGVMVEHRSLANLVTALRSAVYGGERGGLKVSVNAPLVFDGSVKQVVQLSEGHALSIVPESARRDGSELLAHLEARGVEVLDCTPSQLKLLFAAGWSGESGPRRLLVGGEALDEGTWGKLSGMAGVSAYNVYGPTETTVDATAARVEGARPVLGRPLGNVRVVVVDVDLRAVPTWVAGELLIGGAGVARGYVGRPDLTAERFVPDAWCGGCGQRLYRTGDRVRWLPDGRLEYLGRLDGQVKVRGLRIELGEIEGVLLEHPGLSQAAVTVREAAAGDARLVAYVVPSRRPVPGGGSRRRLPNGLEVAQQNRNETDYLYEEIFAKRCYLRQGVRLAPGACVFDVGANIGMFSLFVAGHCPGARIYAFEPIGAIFESLRANAAAYVPGAKLFGHGLSESERTESFSYYPGYSMMSGIASYADAAGEVEVIKRFLGNEERLGSAGSAELLAQAEELLAGRFEPRLETARLRRLSDVMREEGVARIDLLKIDVQRAELDVLRGIDREDWSRIGQVVLEVHDQPGSASAGRLEQIRALLEGFGFGVAVEQDALLAGTDRYNVYAVREGVPGLAGEQLRWEFPTGAEAPAAADLRAHLKQRLPEYMVPSAYVILESLPLTRNGKVDRSALPAPEAVAAEQETTGAAPRTLVEEVLAGLWSEVLQRGWVGREEDFFDLGGHSLLATQLVSRVREAFRVELPLRTLFQEPTVAGLGQAVEAALRSGAGLSAPPIVPVPREGPLPLSFAQRRLWFLDQLEPGTSTYNSAHAVRLRGSLAAAALAATLSEVVRRHEVLRTTFGVEGGEPVQIVGPAVPVELPVWDLTSLPEAVRPEQARRLAREESRRPFDLSRGPLLRVRLLRLGEDEHIVLFTLHHIVSDAWSMGVLTAEVGALYSALRRGEPTPLPALPVQYADFAVWQRFWLQGDVLERQLDYWRRQLAGAPSTLALPLDRPRPQSQTFLGASHLFSLEAEVLQSLQSLSRREGSTLFMVMLAAFGVSLHRRMGGEHIVVGMDIANRNRSEVENLLGFFINQLVLAIDLSGNPGFRDLLARVRETTLGAYAHQDLPFDRLIEELAPERSLSRTPLFQVKIVYQNTPGKELILPGLAVLPFEIDDETARFDLALTLMEGQNGLSGNFKYAAELFEPESIASLSKDFILVLRHAAADPDVKLRELVDLLVRAEEHGRVEREQELRQAALQSLGAARRKVIPGTR